MSEASERIPSSPVLVVEELTKRYESQLAVERLSFAVAAGEVLGLVGPNGAGKTTTLRSIAGVLPVKQGRVLVAGRDVMREEALAKASLCWVPDDPQPFETLTVFEHLEFTAALYALAEWRPRAEALLAQFELADKRTALGGELSRGMRQKLAFCCAWLPRPKLVLLDEPLSGLDPRAIRKAKDAIRELAREGAAVILSSHQLELIEQLATRLLILDRGRAVFVGTLEEARAAFPAHARGSLEEIFLAATDSGLRGPNGDGA
jgi:ABC-2 type transport system ATP-binding protein